MENAAIEMTIEPDTNAEAGADTNTVAGPETLRTLAIPFRDGQAVLPNSLVVEVLPYAPPLGIDGAPRWVLGSMLWKAQPLPLISLEFLVHQNQAPEVGLHNRIIVVQAVSNQPKLRNFGFVGSEAPRMVELERGHIANEIFLQAPPEGISNQVLVHGERAVIPDMDKIESTLSKLLRSQR